ncbi:Homogentisate 1,2-dioxygenase [Legionella geestiana]|uniref:Homogentisate 1,2-dioxygenase n=1 Tax=Legionella geestiana TaxID=45065 RepID=A0A0W0U8R9_9GAMM|nr:homogentisate 1,2-dioxygenase [Legionella geestiana]KTD04177.1 Homogentisate 1,2-dioxygenase [Legionella geestiana]QBS11602.1 homogentisate 1,2-dioxygenase [Legionella geestiana]QDQ40789.1 homogentisate 1,2-dioxygenase [Legionella geestiana]STX53719.1 Homogentisate 1,2-dioxygenase [Legionella geestiana]
MHMHGFGNYHQSEAISGALPLHQNSPQRCPLGLYAEQLSGTAFTRPRHVNLRSWLYRLLPSVVHKDFISVKNNLVQPFLEIQPPNPFRWAPMLSPAHACDFVDGLQHMAGSERVNAWRYLCNQSMTTRFFVNHDGEMLFVPEQGALRLCTEFGVLTIAPGHMAVIPRGVIFRVELENDFARGYLCENSGVPLALPELGPIGANGLACPRHFVYPDAAFEKDLGICTVMCKSQNTLWQAEYPDSPLNVVAWQGNLAPYKYDLALFNTINTVSFDHPDPSIFTVLTSPGLIPGEANLDFVIFPPRWMVAENTFRPPWFHKNCMSEFMGLIKGTYDAKLEGFLPGGVSIHNAMTAHGPDAQTWETATHAPLKPERYDNTLAFMFETASPWRITQTAMEDQSRECDYSACWQSLKTPSI